MNGAWDSSPPSNSPSRLHPEAEPNRFRRTSGDAPRGAADSAGQKVHRTRIASDGFFSRLESGSPGDLSQKFQVFCLIQEKLKGFKMI